MPSLKSPRLNNLTSYVEIWIRPIAFYFLKRPLNFHTAAKQHWCIWIRFLFIIILNALHHNLVTYKNEKIYSNTISQECPYIYIYIGFSEKEI